MHAGAKEKATAKLTRRGKRAAVGRRDAKRKRAIQHLNRRAVLAQPPATSVSTFSTSSGSCRLCRRSSHPRFPSPSSTRMRKPSKFTGSGVHPCG